MAVRFNSDGVSKAVPAPVTVAGLAGSGVADSIAAAALEPNPAGRG